MHVERNPELTAELVGRMVEVWVAVTEAGGAVGFVAPVTPGEVEATVAPELQRVRDGIDDVAVAWMGDRLVGFGFLVTNSFSLARHWASVKRLQRHPAMRAQGVGTALLVELEACARERGLERVALTVRAGTGREAFYLGHDYRLEARLPGRLRLAPGVTVDELHLSKRIDGVEETSVTDAPPPRMALQRLDPDLPVPGYAHEGDAGLDLYARESVRLAPGERAVLPTGVAVAVPTGCVGLVHPRSGLAARHGIGLVNAPGTVDAGYRGEIQVVVINHGPEPVAVERGDRIAQLVVQRVETVEVVETASLGETARGAGGFGSTGR